MPIPLVGWQQRFIWFSLPHITNAPCVAPLFPLSVEKNSFMVCSCTYITNAPCIGLPWLKPYIYIYIYIYTCIVLHTCWAAPFFWLFGAMSLDCRSQTQGGLDAPGAAPEDRMGNRLYKMSTDAAIDEKAKETSRSAIGQRRTGA